MLPLCFMHRYFNPRSPCGERLDSVKEEYASLIFQSTLPVWGATPPPLTLRAAAEISIHAPRVGSDKALGLHGDGLHISIHAPRVGSDHLYAAHRPEAAISIHAPRVGSDSHSAGILICLQNFNPRSPCGERPKQRRKAGGNGNISIHAPRVGSDSTV